jgi:hypothetical protein
MFVFLDADSPVTVSQDTYTPKDTQSPAAFPRLMATCPAVNPYFSAVLVPTDSTPPPTVRFENTPEETTVAVEWPERTDLIVWNKQTKNRSAAVTFSKSTSNSGGSRVKSRVD